jgi:hypothetical protein
MSSTPPKPLSMVSLQTDLQALTQRVEQLEARPRTPATGGAHGEVLTQWGAMLEALADDRHLVQQVLLFVERLQKRKRGPLAKFVAWLGGLD